MTKNQDELMERTAKALGVPVENVQYASFVLIIEKLVEVIEHDRANK